MRKFLRISILFFATSLAIFTISCNNKLDNMIDINTHIDFNMVIEPGSIWWKEGLTGVGSYATVTGSGNSRGIIVYWAQPNEFMAYDRHPLFIEGPCENYRLEVSLPFIVDSCNDQKYIILNGFNVNGDGTHLYWYQTSFDGRTLRVHN